MNISVMIGLLVALGGLVAGFLIEHGSPAALWQTSAFCIVFGGTFGIALTMSPFSSIKAIPSSILYVFFHKRHNTAKMIDQLCDIANKARKNGLLSLEAEAANIDDPFIRRGLEYIADGVDPEFLRSMLENEIEAGGRHYEAAARVFEGMGGAAPTMGVLGTVMGMVTVLSGDDMDNIGKNIAVAFIATLYGVGSANLLWLPIAGHIKVLVEQDAEYRSTILEGLMAIQAGESSSRLRDRLEAMLASRGKKKDGGKNTEEPAE